MSVTGTFQLEKNENFYQHLLALGIPPEKAETANSLKPILEISIEGNQLTFSSSSGDFKHKSVLTINEEVDETIVAEYNIKSIARIVGEHAIEIESTGDAVERGLRRLDFSETGMIMTIQNDNKTIPVAKRYYVRLFQH